jgi:hypothetical protein
MLGFHFKSINFFSPIHVPTSNLFVMNLLCVSIYGGCSIISFYMCRRQVTCPRLDYWWGSGSEKVCLVPTSESFHCLIIVKQVFVASLQSIVQCVGGGGKDAWSRLRWDRFHKPIWNRTKMPLAIALNGAGRGLRGRDNGGNVNNVQYKSNQYCHYEYPPV